MKIKRTPIGNNKLNFQKNTHLVNREWDCIGNRDRRTLWQESKIHKHSIASSAQKAFQVKYLRILARIGDDADEG